MVIEIAKEDLQLQERRPSEIYPPMDSVVRRMRWGSLKSRSYDNPADRLDRQTVPRYYKNSTIQNRTSTLQQQQQYQDSNAYSSSLERRERSMPPPNSARYYHGSDELSNKYYNSSHSARSAGFSQQKQQLDEYSLATQGKIFFIIYKEFFNYY